MPRDGQSSLSGRETSISSAGDGIPSPYPRRFTGRYHGRAGLSDRRETIVSTTVRAALLQTDWSGDQASMTDKHEEAAREAAADGAQVMCFQELFYGPYFCQVQDAEYYSYTEPIPDGPTTKRFQSRGEGARDGARAADVRDRASRSVLQHGGRDRCRRDVPRQVPQAAHPSGEGLLGEVLLRPGTGGYPVFETAVGKVGVYICYDRHFPEGWRMLGLHGAEIVFNPSATHRGLSEYIWRLEQPAAAVANMYYVGAINRVGIEPLGDDDFYGQSYFVDPEGNSSARSATRTSPS